MPIVVVQHGFVGDQQDPDKTRADALAVWSERDAEDAARRHAAPLGTAVTGNPGAIAAPTRTAVVEGGSLLVLVEYPCRYSASVPARASIHHVRAALEGASSAGLGLPVVIRPHPADQAACVYSRLSDAWPDLTVTVDAESRIEDLIAVAVLCVGATSTATLQAAAAGVPVVVLNVTGRPAPWPLGGSGSIPVAGSAESLGHMLAQATVPAFHGDDASEALGQSADAPRRVVDLVERVTGVSALR